MIQEFINLTTYAELPLAIECGTNTEAFKLVKSINGMLARRRGLRKYRFQVDPIVRTVGNFVVAEEADGKSS